MKKRIKLMFKKIISYTLIFSIFYTDAGYCGGVWGRENREDDPHCITKRQKTDFSDSATGEWTEDTPLVQAGREGINSSDTFSSELPTPSGSFDFHAFAQNSQDPQEKNLAGWTKSRRSESSTNEGEEETVRELMLFGVSDEEEEKVEGLTLLETSDEDYGNEAAPPKEAGQNANEEKEATPTHGHSARALHLLQQGGDLIEVCEEDDDLENPTFSPEQVLAEIQNWFKEKNPDYATIILTLSSLNDHHVGSHTKKCLNYIQERIVEGKLNKKQMASILLGLGVGVGVGVITAVELFGVLVSNFGLWSELIFYHLSFVVLCISIPTLTIDATSRITSFFSHFMRDNTHAFSIQKTKNHQRALLVPKLLLFGISSVMSVVPAYYFSSLLTSTCNDPKCPLPLKNDLLFEILFAATVLDKMTHYGHHLSHHAKHDINRYFFRKTKEELEPHKTAIKRQQYLKEFKELKRMIYGLAGEELSDLYGDIFNKKVNITKGKSDKEKEEINVKEALRVLRIFKNIHRVHGPDMVPEVEEHWKTTGALWGGWGMTFLATIGRHLAFWYAFDEILEDLQDKEWISYLARYTLSIVGGVVAGIIQGVIEIDAIKETVYDILRGKKIPNGSSHYPLRVGIKMWNWFSGYICSLPYLFAGFNALEFIEPDQSPRHPLNWPLWTQIACFIPFGITGVVSVVSSLQNSSLSILNGFDSLMSYCYPFQGYKRDKLIRMTRQFHKLFKNLDPEVLETVDQLLNPLPPEQEVDNAGSKRLTEELF